MISPGPEVVAHRGSSAAEPEHTLAAYLQAIDDGADALECDVRLTSDGTLVCVHDRSIDRTSRGTGSVSGRNVEELGRHDYSYQSWHDFEDPADASRTGLLSLEALLAIARDKKPDIRFAIETKHPVRYGAYVERELAAVLARSGLDRPDSDGRSQARMMSFSWLAVNRMRRLCPNVPAVYLVEKRGWLATRGLLPRSASALGPSVNALRHHSVRVQRLRARGLHVHVWTVDEKDDLALCLGNDVEAVITNRPSRVIGWLNKRENHVTSIPGRLVNHG